MPCRWPTSSAREACSSSSLPAIDKLGSNQRRDVAVERTLTFRPAVLGGGLSTMHSEASEAPKPFLADKPTGNGGVGVGKRCLK